MVAKIGLTEVALAIHAVAARLWAREVGLVVDITHVFDVFCQGRECTPVSKPVRRLLVMDTFYFWAPIRSVRSVFIPVILANMVITPDVLCEMISTLETIGSPILLAVLAGEAFGIILMFSLVSSVCIQSRELLVAVVMLTGIG